MHGFMRVVLVIDMGYSVEIACVHTYIHTGLDNQEYIAAPKNEKSWFARRILLFM